MTVSPREFQVMAKPIGPVCNLDCRYCYYLEKRALYPDSRTFRMPDDLLLDALVFSSPQSSWRAVYVAGEEAQPPDTRGGFVRARRELHG